MTTVHDPYTNLFTWSDEMAGVLDEMRDDALTFALLCLVALSALIGTTPHVRDPIYGVTGGALLLTVGILVWAVRQKSYLAAAWILVGGWFLTHTLMAAWANLGAGVWLMVLSGGLAALLIGAKGGFAVSGAMTIMLLLAPKEWFPGAERMFAVLGGWFTTGLIWLALRPLHTAGQMAWSAYQQSRQFLEESRDHHQRLEETLKDLGVANQQLVRLNRLADGLRQAAEEARRAKGQFVANVSHELRTPLNMIIGFSEMIVNAPEAYGRRLPAALVSDLAVILRNSRHLAELIDDVLDLSQLEAGRMALVREPIALPEVIAEAVTAVRPLFESKNLSLTTKIYGELQQISADPTRIREVLLNLLSNAGRVTADGGVTVRAEQQNNALAVSVTDTGPGIPETDLPRLFQQFHQLDGSLRRPHGGTGLGLSISKEFVELHGGKMWVQSEPGMGTTFFFTLPLDTPPPPAATALRWLTPGWEFLQRTTSSPTSPMTSRPRIILCETGESLHRVLSRHWSNVEVVLAADLAKAIDETVAAPAQALLINADSVAETLQRPDLMARLPLGKTPVIVCSVPGTPEAATSLGVAAYLVKPVSRESLLATLEHLPLGGKTILVADDDEDALRLVRRALTAAGCDYRVLTATDGREAWRVLLDERPDALLLDLWMPEMDGFALLAAKNAEPMLRDTPTVVVSARDPSGQPIVSKTLAVTCRDGLSLPQLLACTEAISSILSPVRSPADPARSIASLA